MFIKAFNWIIFNQEKKRENRFCDTIKMFDYLIEPFILFLFLSSNYIEIQIIDNESYEKDAVFYVELGDPIWEQGKIQLNILINH